MRQKERKYLITLAIVGSILSLSLKDTFRVLHTVLHSIPNSIHYHPHKVSSFHTHSGQKRSFFHHDHSHSLDDHLHEATDTSVPQKDGVPSPNIEKQAKVLLFLSSLSVLVFLPYLVKEKPISHGWAFFSSATQTPPSPPPDVRVQLV